LTDGAQGEESPGQDQRLCGCQRRAKKALRVGVRSVHGRYALRVKLRKQAGLIEIEDIEE
jgi:hypothetical protein